jgi:hypothetical protein
MSGTMEMKCSEVLSSYTHMRASACLCTLVHSCYVADT